MLYNIIIAPIEIIVEWAFLFIYNRFSSLNVIFSIIGVSLVINFLALPLYNIADKLQEKERNISKALEYRVKRIKKAFKGDEQFMMINEYYRQNNYHPLYVLRSSLSILIEIPFFIAAYHYLSHCEQLVGAQWFLFKDLGQPDELIKLSIAGKIIIINVLPVIMTLINFVSGAIYCKEAPLKENLQLYGVAVVFLVLLYKSPSGLVIYWILNNLFSLFKNIVMKMKNPKKVLHIILTFCLFGLSLLFIFFKPDTDLWKKIFLVLLTVIFALIPYFISLFKNSKLSSKNVFSDNNSNIKEGFWVFISSGFTLFILCGLLLPSSVIASSPVEFSFLGETQSPLTYIYSSLSFFFGMFVLWPFIIYKMFNQKVKNAMPLLFFVLAVSALFNVYVFKPHYGTLTNLFQVESKELNLSVSKIFYLLSAFVSLFVIFVFILLKKFKKTSFIFLLMVGVSIAELSFSLYRISFIKKEFNEYAKIKPDDNEVLEIEPVYHLSKTKENVLVLFLDRGIGSFPEYFFEQFPEIKDEFSGFTYYPNTLSTGSSTISGFPTITGGYEYTTYENYKKSDRLLIDKHNEALLVMPRLFLDAGYDVTFTDPSMSNYAWEGDFTPFKPYPEIKVSTQLGKYTTKYLNEKNISMLAEPDKYAKKQIKNFSFIQILFPALRIPFYNTVFIIDYDPKLFLDSFSHLYYLPELFNFDSDSKTFTIVENELPHRAQWLKLPDYEIPTPQKNISKNYYQYKNHDDNDLKDYVTNIAAFKQLAKLLKLLKQNGVYDNTRIIIVSDHGYDHIFTKFNNFEDPLIPSEYNCLLLFKDFNSNFPVKTDPSFMTNADTLFLAKQNTDVSNINPFTNKELKQEKDYVICCKIEQGQWNCRNMLEKTQIDYSHADCWRVHDDISNPSNWEAFDIDKGAVK